MQKENISDDKIRKAKHRANSKFERLIRTVNEILRATFQIIWEKKERVCGALSVAVDIEIKKRVDWSNAVRKALQRETKPKTIKTVSVDMEKYINENAV